MKKNTTTTTTQLTNQQECDELSLSLSLWPNCLQMRPRMAQKILLFRETRGRSPTSTGNHNAATWRWETKNLEVVNSRKTFAQDFENGHFAVKKAKSLSPCVAFSVSLNLDPFCGTRVLYPPTLNQVRLELDLLPHYSLSLFCPFYGAQPSFVF
jgi:hypothetical protein